MSVAVAPLTNHLLLVIEPMPEKSKLIVSPNLKEDLVRFGTIKAIGPEVRDLKPGQRVIASITAGTELKDNVVMIREPAVLAIEHV